MGRTAKPRKPHRPRAIQSDPVSWAVAGVHTLFNGAREAMLKPINDAMLLLKQGKADRDDWNMLAQGINVSEALAAEQVGRNLLLDIRAGQAALQSVALRMAAGGNSTCRAPELAAIDEAIFVYTAQLKVCTQADLGRAVRRVKALHASGAMDDVGRLYESMKQTGSCAPIRAE